MDEHVESLRRALREDPSDLSSALKLAAALEKAGRFDEAWELLESREAPEALAGLAAQNSTAVLRRLLRLDYSRARAMIDRLAAIGQSRHAALLSLACHKDRVLRGHALKALAVESREVPELRGVAPETLLDNLDRPDPTGPDRRIRWRGFAHKLMDRGGSAQAALLLPWLVPMLTCNDPVLAGRALAIVRRLTDRDGPPFDAELLARLLQQNEGEAA